MEIKITINVGDNDPIEIKVDVPVEGEKKVDKPEPKLSKYVVFFDETSLGWSTHAGLNKAFLIQQQNRANELLRQKGYLFLNEVYDMLGVPRTACGRQVGWVYDADNPIGDNYVDFGIFEERNHDFVNGFEMTALLDFNVDGDILKYL